MEKRHRVNVYLSEEEYELLKNRQNESGKSQSEVLKESLYREQNITVRQRRHCTKDRVRQKGKRLQSSHAGDRAAFQR